MARSTIRDVALHANLSVSTVNRALNEPDKVREETLRAVLHSAEAVGFYGVGSLKGSLVSIRPKLRVGILLMQRNRTFYKAVATAFEAEVKLPRDYEIVMQIDYQDDVSPQNVSEKITRLAENADAIGVVSPEHPIVSATIERLSEQGKKFFGLISPQTARCGVGYVGLDAWKVGRTAGWAVDNFCRKDAAKIGILVGNHRFRNQDSNESGFRSYFREHASGFELLEPKSTFENSDIARELTEELLARHPDLAALFVCGGGISGVVAALRNTSSANSVYVVAYDLTELTRSALLDGTVNFLISHPLQNLAEETFAAMIRAFEGGPDFPPQSVMLPFEIYTPENL